MTRLADSLCLAQRQAEVQEEGFLPLSNRPKADAKEPVDWLNQSRKWDKNGRWF